MTKEGALEILACLRDDAAQIKEGVEGYVGGQKNRRAAHAKQLEDFCNWVEDLISLGKRTTEILKHTAPELREEKYSYVSLELAEHLNGAKK